MSSADDYRDEMFRRFDLDDDTVDSILSGRDPGRTEVAALVAFAEDARSAARRPAPVPSARLAAILTEGLTAETGVVRVAATGNLPSDADRAVRRRGWRKKKTALVELLAGLSIGGKVALGFGVAAAAVAGAGAAGALPGPAQHAIASTVGAVTPFELPDNTNSHTDNHADSHADFGKTVSSEANGTSDGQPGVDGQSVASTAADNGSSVARDTPAGDHPPVSVPPTAHSSNEPPAAESSDSHQPPQADAHSSNPPSDPGSQSSNGISHASGTPAGDHVPAQVPPPHP